MAESLHSSLNVVVTLITAHLVNFTKKHCQMVMLDLTVLLVSAYQILDCE